MNSFHFGLFCVYALAFGRFAHGQAEKGERFLCTAVPIGADSCPVPPEPLQSSSAQEEELRNTVMQLRETILQQKETIVNQLGTIKELTSKLTICESASDSSGSWRKTKQDTMDDVPRDPNDTVYNMGKTMQSLKDRLENLEVWIFLMTCDALGDFLVRYISKNNLVILIMERSCRPCLFE